MVLKIRVLVVLAAVAAVGVFMAHAAFAQGSGTTPGWGFGDTHHVHTGPPGQSVHP